MVLTINWKFETAKQAITLKGIHNDVWFFFQSYLEFVCMLFLFEIAAVRYARDSKTHIQPPTHLGVEVPITHCCDPRRTYKITYSTNDAKNALARNVEGERRTFPI
jgi:hypothetical protein